MKITKSQLKQIIKEEVIKVLKESHGSSLPPDIEEMIYAYQEEDANDSFHGQLYNMMHDLAVYQIEQDPHLEYGGEPGVNPDYLNTIDHILSALEDSNDPRYQEYERELSNEKSALTQAVKAAADNAVDQLMSDGTYDDIRSHLEHERSGVD